MNQILFKTNSRNKVCIFPDEKVKSVDGMPAFKIYTQSPIGLSNHNNDFIKEKLNQIKRNQRFKSVSKTGQEVARTTFG